MKTFKEFVTEAMSDADKTKIKEIMTANTFLNLRAPLTQAGFTVDYSNSPFPYYMVKKGGSKVAITNKKNADDYEFEINGIAMGEM